MAAPFPPDFPWWYDNLPWQHDIPWEHLTATQPAGYEEKMREEQNRRDPYHFYSGVPGTKHWMVYSLYALHFCISTHKRTKDVRRMTLCLETCVYQNFWQKFHCKNNLKDLPKNFTLTLSELCNANPATFNEHAWQGLPGPPVPNFYGRVPTETFTSYQVQGHGRDVCAPVGQMCLDVRYKTRRLFFNDELTDVGFHAQLSSAIELSFNIDIHLGLNITFRTFYLSDLCLPSTALTEPLPGEPAILSGFHPNCGSLEGTEYVGVGHLFFCQKRPKWSVFSRGTFSIRYFLCRVCTGQTSTVVFDYQTIDEGLRLTHTDQFTLVTQFQPLPKDAFALSRKGRAFASMVIRRHMCVKTLILKGMVFEIIGLRVNTNMFLLHMLDMTRTIKQFVKGGKGIISYHQCFLQIDEPHSTSCKLCTQEDTEPCTAVAAKIDFVFLKHFHKTKFIDNGEQYSATHGDTCTNLLGCRMVHHLQSQRHSYIHSKINEFKFSGWKTFSCFYGGISFFETITAQNDYLPPDSQAYSTEKKGQKRTLNLCSHTISHNASKVHEQTEPFPYTSAGQEVIVAVYYLFGDSMKFSLTFVGGKCKGIFIDTCSVRQLNEFQTFPHIFPHLEKDFEGDLPILHYQVTDLVQGTLACVVYQMGRVYFKETFNFHVEEDLLRDGCEVFHEMRDRGWVERGRPCSGLSFSVYFKNSHMESRYERSQFTFVNRLTNMSTKARKFNPLENSEDLFQIRKLVSAKPGSIVFMNHTSEKDFDTFHFDTDVHFVPKNRKLVFDSLLMSVGSLSESVAILTYKLKKCGTLTRTQGAFAEETIVVAPGEDSISFRGNVFSVLDNNVYLKLTYENEQFFNSLLGKVEAYSNLCLNQEHLHKLPLKEMTTLLRQNVFRQCAKELQTVHRVREYKVVQENDGEDKVIWEADLHTTAFLMSRKGLFLELPGKIFEIQLHTSDGGFRRDNFTLETKWFFRHEKVSYMIRLRKFGVFIADIWESEKAEVPALYMLSQLPAGRWQFRAQHETEYRGYKEPKPHSWHRANHTCVSEGYQLPVLVRSVDVRDLLERLHIISFNRLVKHLFLGISRLVRELAVLTQIDFLWTVFHFVKIRKMKRVNF